MRSVHVRAPNDVVVVARMSGEGETSLEKFHFRLSRGGDALSWLAEGAPMVYHRCPASPR